MVTVYFRLREIRIAGYGFPVSDGATPPNDFLTISPSGHWLVVGQPTAIQVYAIDATTGGLTPASTPMMSR